MALVQASSRPTTRYKPTVIVPSPELENGSRSTTDGVDYVYYDGYWVRYYEPLEESLASR